MRAYLAAAMLAVSPAIAHAQDVPEQALEARLSGDPARAIALLRPWLAEHPDDVDARLQLGYALLAQGRLAEAEAQFAAVLAAAPDYTDARDGLALVASRRAAEPRGFVAVEGGVSKVSGARNWREAGLLLVLPSDRDTLEMRGMWYDRFGLEDVEASALYTRRTSPDTWLRIGAGATPGADFRPELSLTAGIDRRLGDAADATILGLDATWRKFPAQDVWTVTPAVTQYVGSVFALTARANAVAAEGDALRLGGSLRGDYLPAERTRAYIGAAAGPDTDLGVVTDTRALFAGGEIPLDERVSLYASLAREWRDGPADRTDFRLGFKIGL